MQGATPPGQFIALQAFNGLKDAILDVCTAISIVNN